MCRIILVETDNLSKITVKSGELVKFILKEISTSGFCWYVDYPSTNAILKKHYKIVTDAIGGTNTVIFKLMFTKPAIINIEFKLRREWMPDKVIKSYKIDVEIR